MINKTISHYKVLEELGRGGMGVVYKAEDTKLKRTVALKFLPHHLLSNEEDKTRFLHEAQSASGLNHPNIMTIYEVDEVEGETFIAMEFVEGETLKDKVEEGPLKTKELLNIAIAVADGLNAAHEQEIVHRDIKSENIMISKTGLVKIMDFGLAKRKGMSRVTKTGSTLGTLAYMSPEQAEGLEVDRRSDLFSFGVVMYEMATGQLPFKGEHDAAILYSIVNEAPLPVTTLNPNIAQELERFIHKALEKEVEDRYQHSDDLAADLKKLKKDLESGKTTITTARIPISGKPLWRQPFSILMAVMAVIIVIFGVKRILEKGDEKAVAIPRQKSIAVMPFENLTGEESFDVWQKGIPELLITALSTSKELYVLDSQTLFDVLESMGQEKTAQALPSLARQVASKVNVETVILGNILKAGEKIRVQVKMQDAESGKVLKSEMADGETEDDLFDMAKILSDRVKDYLEIEVLEQDVDYDIRLAFTSSAEAYRHYTEGMSSFYLLDYGSAIQSFTKAVEIDTSFTAAYFWLYLANFNRGDVKNGMKYFEMADRHKNKSTNKVQLMVEIGRGQVDKDPFDEIKSLKRILEVDPQLRVVWYELGRVYSSLQQYNRAVEPLEKAMELSFQWGSGWKWVPVYTVLGNAYHQLGQHDKEMIVYEKGLSVLRDHPRIIRRLAIEYLSRNDTAQANFYLAKYQSKLEEERWSQARIMHGLGSIYWDADDLTNAEKFYRRALDMDPKDSATLNGLAYLLINYDINVDEGMDLVQQALEIEPDEPEYLDTQGWGYYKLGRYGKSVELLEQAWEKYAYYEHDAYQHIEQAQSALAQ